MSYAATVNMKNMKDRRARLRRSRGVCLGSRELWPLSVLASDLCPLRCPEMLKVGNTHIYIYRYIHMYIYIYRDTRICMYLSIYLSICLSVCLSVRLSRHRRTSQTAVVSHRHRSSQGCRGNAGAFGSSSPSTQHIS